MILTSILGVVSFSGCTSFYGAYHGETKPNISYVKLEYGNVNKNKEDKKIKDNKNDVVLNGNDSVMIFVWSPKNSAALINKEGKGCIQGADVFHNQDASVDVSNDLLKLVKGISIDGNASTKDKLLAIQTVSQITQLKSNTERNTYLSIGMFGLCQLYANGKLTETELKELVEKLIDKSASITPKFESLTTVTSTKNAITAEEPKK